MGHDRRAIVANTSTGSNSHNFRAKIPVKKMMYPSLFLNFWFIREGIKQNLKFFVIPPRLDLIAKQMERDWSRIPPWYHRIFKKLSKFDSIHVN